MIKGLVSVMIPCFNHEKYVLDCLKSIIAQDYDNIEVIINDDCSTDNSRELIQGMIPEIRKRYKRVLFKCSAENRGVVASLNSMLENAEGEYVFEIASDDMMNNTCISDLVNFFLMNPMCDIALSNGFFVTQAATYENPIIVDKFYKKAINLDINTLFRRLYEVNLILATSVCIKSKVFSQYGSYDPEIGIEDWEYWLRVSSKGMVQWGYIDKCNVYYRLNNNSMSSKINSAGMEKRRMKMHKSEIAVIDKYRNYVSKPAYAARKTRCMKEEIYLAKTAGLDELESKVADELLEFKKEYIYRMDICDRLTYIWLLISRRVSDKLRRTFENLDCV